MTEKTYPYPINQCPASVDGICEAGTSCPYGCDEQLADLLAKEDRDERLVLQASREYVVWRLLMTNGAVQRFKDINAPDAIIKHTQKRVDELQPFVTPEIQKKYEELWPGFYKHFKVLGAMRMGHWQAMIRFPDTASTKN